MAAAKKVKPVAEQIKILCVDDEEISLTVLKNQVEKMGFIPLTANSPEKALAILEKEAADVALVISDYKMPEMTGLELGNIITAKWHEIPFALMSSGMSPGIQQHIESSKAVGFVKKPLTREMVESFIKNKSASRIKEIADERDIVTSAVEEYTLSLEELESLILELEETPSDTQALNRIFGIIHTIKGTSSFFRPRSLSKFCHLAEDSLVNVKSGQIPVTSNVVTILLKTRDVIVELVEALKNGDRTEKDLSELAKIFQGVGGKSSEVVAKQMDMAKEPSQQRAKDWIKVSRAVIENFLKTNGEITIIRNMIDKFLRMELAQGHRDPKFEQLYRMFEQMFKHQGLMHTQMSELKKVSLAEVFRQTRRIVRDLNKELGKNVNLNIEGEDLRVDDSLIEMVNVTMVHTIRNAMDHGIENAEERAAKQKDPAGTINVKVYEQEEMVFLEIWDDGRGIDVERIRKKVVEKGMYSESDAKRMTDKQLTNLIFESGFSTAEKVTSVSGRGVGLDMVNSTLRSIKGDLNVESVFGQGTKFTMRLPTPKSIVIFKSLIIDRQGISYAIPQESIRQVIKADYQDKEQFNIQYLDSRPIIRMKNESVKLFKLEELLGETQTTSKYGVKSEKKEAVANLNAGETVIILNGVTKPYGMIIDAVLGLEDTVVKPLGSNYENRTSYLGATILGNGEVGLVINPEGIAKGLTI